MKRTKDTLSSGEVPPQSKKARTVHKGTFPIHSHKNDKFPFYRKPTEIGCFSTDTDNKFCDDNHMLQFYKAPASEKVLFDLRKGYHEFIRKDESEKGYLNDILKWIGRHKDKFSLPGADDKSFKSLHTDVICWRGLLTRLLCTPYERHDGWIIAVTLYKGTLYLCEVETDKKRNERERRPPRQDEMCYWGWKFEQYLTSDAPDSNPDPTVPVNNKAAYGTVVRTRLQDHSIVFAGEVDAIDVTTKPSQYVELKTTREITTPRQEDNFKQYKLLKWWAQSFLPAVPTIVAGFRDDDGMVHRIHTYVTTDIPKLVKSIRNPWDPCVCFNFLNDILTFLKDAVTIDDHRHVHLLTWEEGTPEAVLTDDGTDSHHSFLPSWYIQEFDT